MNRTIVIIDLVVIAVLLFIVFTCSCNTGGSDGGFFGWGSGSDDPVKDGKESLFDAVKGSNWLVTFSILGMAAGVFAMLNGSKMGIPAIVACAVSLFMALAVARFATWMAVCGMVGACAAVAISVIVKNRALKEVVGNVRDIKESASNGGSKKVLCKDIKSTLLKQTKSTQKLVGKIRTKLKNGREKDERDTA